MKKPCLVGPRPPRTTMPSNLARLQVRTSRPYPRSKGRRTQRSQRSSSRATPSTTKYWNESTRNIKRTRSSSKHSWIRRSRTQSALRSMALKTQLSCLAQHRRFRTTLSPLRPQNPPLFTRRKMPQQLTAARPRRPRLQLILSSQCTRLKPPRKELKEEPPPPLRPRH